MKCPKCGSEDTIGKMENGYCYCNHCKSRIDRYQQRLDKVLSKFESERLYISGAINIYKTQDIDNNVIFYLDSDIGFANTALKLSLETVESLLKDLEEKE